MKKYEYLPIPSWLYHLNFVRYEYVSRSVIMPIKHFSDFNSWALRHSANKTIVWFLSLRFIFNDRRLWWQRQNTKLLKKVCLKDLTWPRQSAAVLLYVKYISINRHSYVRIKKCKNVGYVLKKWPIRLL